MGRDRGRTLKDEFDQSPLSPPSASVAIVLFSRRLRLGLGILVGLRRPLRPGRRDILAGLWHRRLASRLWLRGSAECLGVPGCRLALERAGQPPDAAYCPRAMPLGRSGWGGSRAAVAAARCALASAADRHCGSADIAAGHSARAHSARRCPAASAPACAGIARSVRSRRDCGLVSDPARCWRAGSAHAGPDCGSPHRADGRDCAPKSRLRTGPTSTRTKSSPSLRLAPASPSAPASGSRTREPARRCGSSWQRRPARRTPRKASSPTAGGNWRLTRCLGRRAFWKRYPSRPSVRSCATTCARSREVEASTIAPRVGHSHVAYLTVTCTR
jgi:hypothetical protein